MAKRSGSPPDAPAIVAVARMEGSAPTSWTSEDFEPNGPGCGATGKCERGARKIGLAAGFGVNALSGAFTVHAGFACSVLRRRSTATSVAIVKPAVGPSASRELWSVWRMRTSPVGCSCAPPPWRTGYRYPLTA